jgi:hypothetical protein
MQVTPIRSASGYLQKVSCPSSIQSSTAYCAGLLHTLIRRHHSSSSSSLCKHLWIPTFRAQNLKSPRILLANCITTTNLFAPHLIHSRFAINTHLSIHIFPPHGRFLSTSTRQLAIKQASVTPIFRNFDQWPIRTTTAGLQTSGLGDPRECGGLFLYACSRVANRARDQKQQAQPIHQHLIHRPA